MRAFFCFDKLFAQIEISRFAYLDSEEAKAKLAKYDLCGSVRPRQSGCCISYSDLSDDDLDDEEDRADANRRKTLLNEEANLDEDAFSGMSCLLLFYRRIRFQPLFVRATCRWARGLMLR